MEGQLTFSTKAPTSQPARLADAHRRKYPLHILSWLTLTSWEHLAVVGFSGGAFQSRPLGPGGCRDLPDEDN